MNKFLKFILAAVGERIVEKVKVAQLCPTLYHPMPIQSMEFSRPKYWSG